MSNRIPILMFLLAVVLVGFAAGFYVGNYKKTPYFGIVRGIKAFNALVDTYHRSDTGEVMGYAGIAPEEAPAHRFLQVEDPGSTDSFLFYGGRFQFLEECGGTGCLAAIYDASGTIVQTYPMLSEQIFAANIASASEFPYETSDFIFARDARLTGAHRLGNGDLLVVFNNYQTFPFGGGVGRVGPDGQPRWFRWDYSHHWATVVNDDRFLVPGLRIGKGSIKVNLGDSEDSKFQVKCSTWKPLVDTVNVINGDGELVQQIDVLQGLLDSPDRAMIQHTSDACDPTHLNYVDQLDASAEGVENFAPGDLVVSLRNISAFAIIDGQTGKYKRLVKGSFIEQHSVHHLEAGKFLMFDNQGANPPGTSRSRLLMVDVVSGKETTVFPRPDTPAAYQDLFSYHAGKVAISPDKKRATISFTGAGRGVEVRIADGVVLRSFDSVHNASSVTDLDAKKTTAAARYALYGVDYLQ